jgi:hypothetical protein
LEGTVRSTSVVRTGHTRDVASPEWVIGQDVREDADSVFVPSEQLPLAEVGDAVTFTSELAGARTGRITGRLTDGRRGTFLTVELDRPAD